MFVQKCIITSISLYVKQTYIARVPLLLKIFQMKITKYRFIIQKTGCILLYQPVLASYLFQLTIPSCSLKESNTQRSRVEGRKQLVVLQSVSNVPFCYRRDVQNFLYKDRELFQLVTITTVQVLSLKFSRTQRTIFPSSAMQTFALSTP
jgi:hypothetical protein